MFIIEVLEEVQDNKAETDYRVRPDNLSLAEHYYINRGAAYNKDLRIVSDEFADLLESKAWRTPIDAETKDRLASAQPYTYLVAKRKTCEAGVLVLAFNENDAKEQAARASAELASLAKNVAARRVGQEAIDKALGLGALDARMPG